jgi:hypothetical protein
MPFQYSFTGFFQYYMYIENLSDNHQKFLNKIGILKIKQLEILLCDKSPFEESAVTQFRAVNMTCSHLMTLKS